MTGYQWLHAAHLVAAAVWVGGLITLAALVGALRRQGVSREVLRGVARQFGRLSWAAMAVAITTGIAQVEVLALPWSYGALHVKMTAVAVVVIVAGIHQLTARRSSPAVRGIVQLLILLASLVVVVAATRI